VCNKGRRSGQAAYQEEQVTACCSVTSSDDDQDVCNAAVLAGCYTGGHAALGVLWISQVSFAVLHWAGCLSSASLLQIPLQPALHIKQTSTQALQAASQQLSQHDVVHLT
jgi:hypothetical protein